MILAVDLTQTRYQYISEANTWKGSSSRDVYVHETGHWTLSLSTRNRRVPEQRPRLEAERLEYRRFAILAIFFNERAEI